MNKVLFWLPPFAPPGLTDPPPAPETFAFSILVNKESGSLPREFVSYQILQFRPSRNRQGS